MTEFTIVGGYPLYGSIRLGGAKNASFKLMIASLLGQTSSRLLNFSHINEVTMVAEVIQSLGAKVDKRGERTLFIDPVPLAQYRVKEQYGQSSRSAPMFIPVLLHRFGKAWVPLPGGDKLGHRPIDWHLEALRQMGAKVSNQKSYLKVEASSLKGIDFTFPKNSHTGTETILMAAVLAHGKTLIRNAALEPEIDDLIAFLNSMGGHIRRRLDRIIEVEGVANLHGTIHQIMPDRNEAVSYACAALITRGDIIIENAQPQYLAAFLEKLTEIGAGLEVGAYGLHVYYDKPLRAADVQTEPYPGFMTDWQPVWAVLATQLIGESVIHETVYPSRFQYLPQLEAMDAKVQLFNPQVAHPDNVYNFTSQDDDPANFHAVRIFGPCTLTAGTFTCQDLRHGATLVLAAMAASGTSHIKNIEQIDRGYEDLDGRLRSMGAHIVRLRH